MEIGDFGHARFPQEKKGFKTMIDAFGHIKSIEKKYLLFEDNDGFPYLVEKGDFTWEEWEFKKK